MCNALGSIVAGQNFLNLQHHPVFSNYAYYDINIKSEMRLNIRLKMTLKDIERKLRQDIGHDIGLDIENDILHAVLHEFTRLDQS